MPMCRKSRKRAGIFGTGEGRGEKKMKRIKKALLLTLLVTAALCMMGAGRKKDEDSRTLAEKLEGMNADALNDCLSERREPVRLWIASRGEGEVARAVDLICAVVEDNGGSVKELGNE